MFITENQKIGDSVLFLLCARSVLSNIIEESKVDNAKELMNYLHNEASDYEVMNLLITGKMSDEKYNEVAEMQLFSILKEQMLRSHDIVTEAVGEGIFQNVLNEVDSVYPVLTTTVPVLEFMSHQDRDVAAAFMLSEQVASPAAMAAMRNIPKAGILSKAKLAAAHAKTAATGLAKSAGTALAKGKALAMKGLPALKAFAASPAGMAIGGAALAALLAYASVKTYKRFLSQAAKACGGMSGKSKTMCMAKFKKQALMKQAADIQSGASVCAKVKNPEKCKAGVAKKIAGLKAKAAKVGA